MSLRERFGCFFLVLGLAFFALFAVPIVQSLRRDPAVLPAEWIVIALAAALVFWAGWKLFRSGQKRSDPEGSASLWERYSAHRQTRSAEDDLPKKE